MGYRITYENGTIRKKTVRTWRIHWKRWSVAMASVALALMLILPGGRLAIRDLLLPGDEAVTAAALEGMIEDIQDGDSVGEALETFCREILTHGA